MPTGAARRRGHLQLDRVSKAFGTTAAVQAVSLQVEPGEFFALVGPSGCGKTTLLRLIAGFEQPDAGRVVLGGRDVSKVPVHRRDVGMVFQNYALFPHMDVTENVAFGLRARGLSLLERDLRIHEALERVELGGLGHRRPEELSGGQQQRVALARALAIAPEFLLLDEPLSNLDARLREETGAMIRELQRRVGITTIYVTHDQEEAMTLSDRLALMRDGRCLQVGRPEQVYRRPRNLEAAALLGRTNRWTAKVLELAGGAARLAAQGFEFRAALATEASGLEPGSQPGFPQVGQELIALVRPEDLRLCPSGVPGEAAGAVQQAAAGEQAVTVVSGSLELRTYHGSIVRYRVRCGSEEVKVLGLPRDEPAGLAEGQNIQVAIPAAAVTLLPPD